MDTGRMDTQTFRVPFMGSDIEFAPLTDAQLSLLARLDEASSIVGRDLHRLFRVLESRMGEDDWRRIDDGMADGTIDLSAMVKLVADVTEESVKLLEEEKLRKSIKVAPVSTADDDPEIRAAEAALAKLREAKK